MDLYSRCERSSPEEGIRMCLPYLNMVAGQRSYMMNILASNSILTSVLRLGSIAIYEAKQGIVRQRPDAVREVLRSNDTVRVEFRGHDDLMKVTRILAPEDLAKGWVESHLTAYLQKLQQFFVGSKYSEF